MPSVYPIVPNNNCLDSWLLNNTECFVLMKEENNPTLYKQQRLKHHEHLLLLKPEIILYFDKRIKTLPPRAKRDNRSNNMVTGA